MLCELGVLYPWAGVHEVPFILYTVWMLIWTLGNSGGQRKSDIGTEKSVEMFLFAICLSRCFILKIHSGWAFVLLFNCCNSKFLLLLYAKLGWELGFKGQCVPAGGIRKDFVLVFFTLRHFNWVFGATFTFEAHYTVMLHVLFFLWALRCLVLKSVIPNTFLFLLFIWPDHWCVTALSFMVQLR